jgi:hypothetical protein
VSGFAVGGTALLILGAVVSCLVWRVRRSRNKKPNVDVALNPAKDSGDQSVTAYGGVPVGLNDTAIYGDSEYVPAAPADALKRLDSGRSSKRDSEFTSARVEGWLIDSSELKLGATLGQGAFGVVRRGEWRGAHGCRQADQNELTSATSKAVAAFEDEIARMAALEPPRQRGATATAWSNWPNGDVAAVVEYCAQGALANAFYCVGHKRVRTERRCSCCTIADDAARGVMHLHANSIVHRDIAARNVLLAGQSRPRRQSERLWYGAQASTARTLVPVEQQTDGVGRADSLDGARAARAAGLLQARPTCLRLACCCMRSLRAAAPWPGVANVNVITQVVTGARMQLPDVAGVPAEARAITLRCWAHEARDRPSMREVEVALEKAICQARK